MDKIYSHKQIQNMKINLRTLVRWKVYLDRSRVYIALAQFTFIGVILARSLGWDVRLFGAVILTLVFILASLAIGFLDMKLGVRSEEFRNLSESNPLMMQILHGLDRIESGVKIPELDKISSSGLRRIREISGLSLRQVSLATGISSSTVSRIEQGKECKLSNINKLIQFYDTKSKDTGRPSTGGAAPELRFEQPPDGGAGSGSEYTDQESPQVRQDREADQKIHEEEVQN
jgi:hypothetical protein